MDPALIPDFVALILAGEADYVKGNRFFYLDQVRAIQGAGAFPRAEMDGDQTP